MILLALRKSNFGPLFGIFEKFNHSLLLLGFCENLFVIISILTTPFIDLLKGQTRKSTKPILWNTTLDLAFKELKDWCVDGFRVRVNDYGDKDRNRVRVY